MKYSDARQMPISCPLKGTGRSVFSTRRGHIFIVSMWLIFVRSPKRVNRLSRTKARRDERLFRTCRKESIHGREDNHQLDGSHILRRLLMVQTKEGAIKCAADRKSVV